MRSLLFVLLVSVVLSACGERSDDARNDSTAVTVPASPAPPSVAPPPPPMIEPLDSGTFADHVKTAYSQRKTNIPKSFLDSAMLLRDPQKINARLEGYMNSRDSVARTEIAERYHITLDSVNVIVGKKAKTKK